MLTQKGFHVMAKPVGPICNLKCEYCFYLEKENFFQNEKINIMSDEVLEAYINKYINGQDTPEVAFVWQGGEPTLTGIDFYKKAIAFQKKYASGKTIYNSIQTNGTLFNEKWYEFFKEAGFLVGISFDGPKFLHDRYRLDKNGKPTFDRVIRSIYKLIEYDIPFNVLTCVSKQSLSHAKQIYRFLRGIGVKFIQFSPLVERIPDEKAKEFGIDYAFPPLIGGDEELPNYKLTNFSVTPEGYGNFLIEVFDEWVKNDVGEIFVSNFESVLPAWMGLDSTMCIYAKNCGRSVIIEHNGDIYSCDHFMYPEYKLGNILTDEPINLINSEKQREFGNRKSEKLSNKCKNCEVLFVCRGGCPKHRFIHKRNEDLTTNYLCAGYKKFYTHMHRYAKAIVQLIENNQPASRVMELQKGPILIFNDKSSS